MKKIKTGDYNLELLSAYGKTLDVEEVILYIDYNYSDFLDWKRQNGHPPKQCELPKSREVLDEIKDTYEGFLSSDSSLDIMLFDIESDSERR